MAQASIISRDLVFICSCGGDDDSRYKCNGRTYHLCKNCWKETEASEVDIPDAPETAGLLQDNLTLNPRQTISLSIVTNEVQKQDLADLDPGDHVMWIRPYVLRHHAVIVEKPADDEKLKIIHWSPIEDEKNSLKIQILEQEIEYAKQKGKMYKVKYDPSIHQKNPSNLVLERATALKGLEDYHFFRRNCENFARFCATGVNFNLQFPWLKRKLDQTATSTLFKTTTAIFFTDIVEFSWKARHHFIGAIVVILLELLSMATDLMNAYFEYKYPTSYVRPAKDFQETVVIRVCEFIFGSVGMIIGFIFFERLCIYIGDSICPGMGTWVGFALGTLVVGVIGGFLLGVACKALGNAIGIKMGEKFKCCSVSASTYKPGSSYDAKRSKMFGRYLSRSWKAQVGLTLTIFSCVLLLSFLRKYVKVYKDFRGSTRATCITQQVAYLNEEYPCPVLQVLVIAETSGKFNHSIEHDQMLKSRNTTQLFENERTFHRGTCSYQPRCLENDTKTGIEMDRYLNRFGDLGAKFTCYYQPKDQTLVIRNPASMTLFVHAFLWPNVGIFLGLSLLVYAMVNNRTQSGRKENWGVTLITVLGLTSYFYLLKRIKWRLWLCGAHR